MPDTVLIIAQSARMLAVSARRGRWQPVVLDRFADLDTKKNACAWRKIPVHQNEFNARELTALAQEMIHQYSPVGWVYGSGLESLPKVVEEISRLCLLLGNSADSLRLCATPERFFPALDRLQIAYPETTWEQPGNLTGWLAKQGGGHGGVRVALSPYALAGGRMYFQKRLPGNVFTYSFLAGKRQFFWGAFNRLYQAAYNAQQPFAYAGAINRAELPAGIKKTVMDYARRMIETWDLRGLHGLDFMVTEAGPKVLELNPRPGAVVGLWDEDWSDGLLTAHIQACRGEWPVLPKAGPVRGLRVIFARRTLIIPDNMAWPAWCVDLPASGEKFGIGEPVCSIVAEGNSVARVESRLQSRKQWVEKHLAQMELGEMLI